MISVESAYFGKEFKGFIPEEFGLNGKDAVAQFIAMVKAWDYSRMHFVHEVAANRKAVCLNFLFWLQSDFNTVGINHQQRNATIERLREAWDFNHIDVLLPSVPNHPGPSLREHQG